MTMMPPRLGLDDMVWDNRTTLRASSEATSHAVELLANRQLGSYWQPAVADLVAGAVTVDVYPVRGQLIPSNWLLLEWSDGTSAAPDEWTLSGASAAVAQDTNASKRGCGPYSAAVTRSGADARIYYDIDASQYLGKRVTFGAWAYATVADRAFVSISYAGSTAYYSSAHSGGSSLEWLTVTSGRIPTAATTIRVSLRTRNGDTTAYFSGPLLCEGDTATQTPHQTSADYLGLASHTLGTQDITVTVATSTDNFANTTPRATIVPTTDDTVMATWTPVTAAYWRVSFTGGAYSGLFQLAVMALGMSRSMPRGLLRGWDPRNSRVKAETARNAAGAPLGRLARQRTRRLVLTQPLLTEDDLDALEDVYTHAVEDLQPFFLEWDPGEHRGQALWVWAPDSADWSAPLERLGDVLGTRSWSLDLEAVV